MLNILMSAILKIYKIIFVFAIFVKHNIKKMCLQNLNTMSYLFPKLK